MKYFIFDMGGVLKRSIPYDLIKDEPSMINISNLSGEQIEKYDKYKIEMERGTYSTLDYLRDYSEFFNKKNISYEEYIENYNEIGYKYGGVYKEAVDTLYNLKKDDYKIYMLSNLNDTAFNSFSSEFDISIFDELFLSFKLHMVKPEKDIYEYVIRKINGNPKEMCFFDDKKINIDAAKECQMNGFVTTGETISEMVKKALTLN